MTIDELKKEVCDICSYRETACSQKDIEDICDECFLNGLTIEPKQGEWKHLSGDEWLCSECGHVIWTEGSWEHPLERGKDYCEHCGARMKGVGK